MKILAFHNWANHDSGACIVCDDGHELRYVSISEERLSRVKYSYFFPVRAIVYCLEYFGLDSLDDLDMVVTDYSVDKCLQNTNKRYRKLEADYIKNKLKIDYQKVVFCDHHEAHAASAFYPSSFEDAAILVVDGVGTNGNTNSLYVGDRKHGLSLVGKSVCYGIGMIYTTVTKKILGFGTGQEGKTMGLAALGESVGGDRILDFGGIFDGLTTDYSHFMRRIPSYTLRNSYPKCERKEDLVNEYYSKVAYEVQEECERCMLHLANYAYEVTGKRNLCIAGGVGLNCVANDILLNETPFDSVFIQPAASDAGIPFGLALWGYYDRYGGRNPIFFKNAFTGRSYPISESRALLNRFNIPFKETDLKEVADLLASHNIVAWHLKNSEFGPRALGHRSILADPTCKDMKDTINAKVKHREMFRPFAPSVVEDKAKEYFALRTSSPFMLLAPAVHPEKIDEVPAIVHVDNTARVQTVSEDENPEFYHLIAEFGKISGTPVVLNTSFNDNGEPIVETPMDSLICFLRTQIDYLYLDGLLVCKKDVPDVDGLLSRLIRERSVVLRSSYKRGIELLTEGYSTSELKSYIKAYYPMHQYYSSLHPLVSLQTTLNHEQFKRIVTDKYHHDIIKEYLPHEYSLVRNKFKLIDDVYSNRNLVEPGSLAILYNLSIYLDGQNILNFYKEWWMPVIQPPWSTEVSGSVPADLSNEYISSKDWERFYSLCLGLDQK